MSQFLVLGVSSASIIAWAFHFRDSLVLDRHGVFHWSLWRCLTSPFIYSNITELLMGILLLQQLRLIERRMGSNKYAVCSCSLKRASPRFFNVEGPVSLLLPLHSIFHSRVNLTVRVTCFAAHAIVVSACCGPVFANALSVSMAYFRPPPAVTLLLRRLHRIGNSSISHSTLPKPTFHIWRPVRSRAATSPLTNREMT